jgi:hypothetical protein
MHPVSPAYYSAEVDLSLPRDLTNYHAMPGESYDGDFTAFTPLNINNPSSVGPRTDSPIQWANLPTFSNNHRLFPVYKECTNLLPTTQPVSHLTEMARMSMHFPNMLLRFPRYHNTKLGITYGPDYNFATVLQIQSTGSASKVRFQCQPIFG